jgi:tetratricopeptide (TPR) repeat protein
MGFRFRKSMKIAPGIRLTFGKRSIGISAGVPGSRISLNSSGRVTTSAGIPGSGLYWTESTSLRKRKQSGGRTEESIVDDEVYVEDLPGIAQPVGPRPEPAKATFFSGKAEKALSALFYDIYVDTDANPPAIVFEKTKAVATNFPELALAMQAVQVLHGSTNSKLSDEAFRLADDLWPKREELFSHKLVRKYFPSVIPAVQITPGIYSNERFNMKALGFLYSEILQIQKKYEESLEVVEMLSPDQLTAIAVADLEIALLRFEDAIATTEDIENEDDATAVLLILRGIAFREQEFFDASLECFKQAIAKKDRSEEILNRGLWERAYSYERMGKKAMAKKDLEKILSREPGYDGLMARLKKLNA